MYTEDVIALRMMATRICVRAQNLFIFHASGWARNECDRRGLRRTVCARKEMNVETVSAIGFYCRH